MLQCGAPKLWLLDVVGLLPHPTIVAYHKPKREIYVGDQLNAFSKGGPTLYPFSHVLQMSVYDPGFIRSISQHPEVLANELGSAKLITGRPIVVPLKETDCGQFWNIVN